MKVTVIGYWGGFPAVNEATSGYLFEHDGFRLLVDCGSGVLSKLQNYISVEELDAVIISHYHHDHVADIGPLQYARLIKTNLGASLHELPIYGHSFDRDGFTRLAHKGITKAISYDPEKPLEVGPFTIQFMKTMHPVTCYAMRITAGGTTVVYTADSSYLPEFVPFSENADLLICECNFYAGQNAAPAGHMTSEEAATIARDANVGELWLTHLPHFGELPQLVKEATALFSGKVQLAKTGLVWEK
ncbi:MBL fold metallo-hydrolase [Thermaerobacillus caldiproteolyticus]|uniref:Ribonuclease BN (tRNA processing enzyme) n=1 Tax=Thermaerobacillus caldiproteolyticus TaxID=247480 RepID=A0A7V9Z694_9BACL|nr:MBL fold metallo-hydrolase [Anoxybacillus caldiproteolyticus]MBA2874820.1 ribonuclease BN (tRNA processing enzyme) [Anoxybacillus caldiproteolyticus]QPA31578.1 MBL fold metallo-hydrolase [Anoxybacillus caldiproteolyticus]